MFAYLFRYGSEIPIFSFCIFCWYYMQNWSKSLGIGVGDKGVGGSRPWFEGLGGPLSDVKHCGAGDPWCLLGSSPRSLSSRADHGRVRWLVEGGYLHSRTRGLDFHFGTLGRMKWTIFLNGCPGTPRQSLGF